MDKLITIIEDEPHIGENYRDAFTKRGFKVSLYSDKETALSAMANRLPDLVLIDLGLGADADAGFDENRDEDNDHDVAVVRTAMR